MVYGNHRVITVCGAGNTLRVLAEDLTTGRREYIAVPLDFAQEV